MSELYVAPRGCDRDPGSREAPFASLRQAVAAARQRPAGRRGRILLAGGDYWAVDVVLTAQDSGLDIAAVEGETPVLWGGRPITGWQPDGDRFVAAPLPGVREGKWDFRSLVVNGRLCPRARFPHEGKLRHESVFDVRWMSTTKGGWERKPTREELETLRVRPGDLPDTVDIANLELTLYHAWDESLVGVASFDPATGRIEFSTPAGHPPGAFGNWKEQAHCYVAWNVREGMHEPGQWYLDRTRDGVVYWPLPGEDMATACAVVPKGATVIRLAGTEERPVVDVRLGGLTVCGTTTPLVAGGFGALAFDGAVGGTHVRGAALENLTVCNVGGQGIKLQHADDLRCTRCTVHDTGAGGIVVQGDGATVADSHIHHVGRTYPSGIGLRCGGNRHVIAHNDIHNTPYSAITAGGTGIRVENNRFHHVMEELVDGAAIYMFAAKNCFVCGNVTHDVRDDQAHAYYLDEQSCNSVVENNISIDVAWPLHMHMATGCILRNNVCTATGDLTVSLMNCHRFSLERNVLSAGGRLSLRSSYTGIATLSRNVLHSAAGSATLDLHDRLPSLERNEGPVPAMPVDDNTVIADPQLVQRPGPVLGFEEGSPASRRGIRPLDGTHAGRRIP